MLRSDCPRCRQAGGPCEAGGVAGLETTTVRPGIITTSWAGQHIVRHVKNDPRTHGWKVDAFHPGKYKPHVTFCEQDTRGTCTVGVWCKVTCAACWSFRKTSTHQPSLFGD